MRLYKRSDWEMRQTLDTKSVKASAPVRTAWGLPGFDTPSVCSHVWLWCCTQKEARGEKQRKGETQTWEGGRGFTRWPLEWQRTALNRTGQPNPFSPLRQERSAVLGKRLAPATLCFQWNQQQSSLNFKGNWIRPMSKAFRSPTLKSLALISLPEGKQTVQPTYLRRHWRPQFKRLHLAELQQVSLPYWVSLILLNFQHWASLGVRGPRGGDRETVRRGCLWRATAQNARTWSHQPRKAAASSTLLSLEEDSHGANNSTGKSPLKHSLSLEDLLRFHSHWSSFPQQWIHWSCSLQCTLHPEFVSPCTKFGHEPAGSKVCKW